MQFSMSVVGFLLCSCFVVIMIVHKHVLSMQFIEGLKMGKCYIGNKDIINLLDTVYDCYDECKRRPICTAFSYHRLTRLCRLHAEQGAPGICHGFYFSEKSAWDMTDLEECTCIAGEVCKTTGSNNNVFTCEIKECAMPEFPNNGMILGNEVTIGRRIRYICDQGFDSDGSVIQECQMNGTWTGEYLQCNPTVVSCPVVGSTLWNSSCYFIVTNSALKKVFDAADSYCQANGGHLVHVTSLEEHEYVTSRLATPSNVAATRYWLGLRRSQSGQWYLSDNTTSASFFTWSNGEPGVDDCVVYMYIPDYEGWNWFSVSCVSSLVYPICEYDLAI